MPDRFLAVKTRAAWPAVFDWVLALIGERVW